MKAIKYTARFQRHYQQRIAKSEPLRKQYLAAVDGFLHAPESARDHHLTGKQTGQSALSVTEDYRVIYIDKGDYFLFFDIGTHDQVYE